jgi:hypothetical protein
LYWILRFWLPPVVSALGAAIWATAPLVLHFGQVPMPDILCTTGILAAFWFALRGKLPASSGCFGFAILAKMSVIVFGLPVLVALLVARNCNSLRDFLRLSLLWGWFPLLSLATWEIVLYSFAPSTPMSVVQIWQEGKPWSLFAHLVIYKFLLGCIFPFGIGVLGMAGLLFAVRAEKSPMDARIKWAIIVSNLIFLAFVIRKVAEPQYVLQMLPWFVIGASFGLDYFLKKLCAGIGWRIGFGMVLILHILVALFFTMDLKTSRVHNLPDIERAGELLPPDARVVVIYRFYGAGPAVWLDRNVVPMGVPDRLEESFTRLQAEGFSHVLILDIESLHNRRSAKDPQALLARIIGAVGRAPSVENANMPAFTDPAGPFRQFCDRNFSQMFAAPHVVLYSIAPWHAKN